MINKLTIHKKINQKSNPSSFRYIQDLPHIYGKTFEFKKGLNIIVGQNGSGKSTLLRMMALYLCAIQSGVSVITETWLRSILDFDSNPVFSCDLKHDGSPILFCDPRENIGVKGGVFDNDFFLEGVKTTINKGSTGEKTLERIGHSIGVILEKEKMPDSIENKLLNAIQGYNDVWLKKYKKAMELIQPNIKTGQKTILMDEPESFLSIPYEIGFWKRIIGEKKDRFENLQLVVATHSPFAFDIPFANYIEMEDGYLEKCRNALEFANKKKDTSRADKKNM